MSVKEFSDITAYYDDSRVEIKAGSWVVRTLGEVLAEVDEPAKRWPVNNREVRTEISSQKRAIMLDNLFNDEGEEDLWDVPSTRDYYSGIARAAITALLGEGE